MLSYIIEKIYTISLIPLLNYIKCELPNSSFQSTVDF